MEIKRIGFITSNTLHKQPHRNLYLCLEALTLKLPGGDSRQGQDKVKTRSGQVHGKVRERLNHGQGKINVRLKQSNHNHNHNYNLMFFYTIEINLALCC